jgi:hypothetical protein
VRSHTAAMRLDVGGGGRRIGRQQRGLNIADGKAPPTTLIR